MIKLKVILLGESNVGKTQIAERYCYNNYNKIYTQTVAVDYRNKLIDIAMDTLNINIWDFSGHPDFFEVRCEFYKEADILVLVYDITNKKSLDSLDMWLREANKYGIGKNVQVYVCGNKTDAGSRAVSESEGSSWAKMRSFKYFETSAAKGTGIEELFNDMLQNSL